MLLNLKYEIATVHGIVKVLTAHIIDARGVKIKAANVRVVDGATARIVD